MSRASREKKKAQAKAAAGPAPEKAPWRRLRVDLPAIAAEAATSLLLEADARGLEQEDDETRALSHPDEPPTGRVTLTATFSTEPGLEARVLEVLHQLPTFLPEAADMEIAWSDLFAEDWNAVFKAQWQPTPISERAWIVPSWTEFTPPDGAIALRVDPGLAFGTGTHPTTRLCAVALDTRCQSAPPRQLLDVGTGSGILSLIALKLGAKAARGTDVDPVAVRCAIENAEENGLADRFRADERGPDAEGPVYDACVANILAGPLKGLAPAIARALPPGAPLWLSGLLVEQADEMRAAYEAEGFRVVGQAEDTGWLRLDLVRG